MTTALVNPVPCSEIVTIGSPNLPISTVETNESYLLLLGQFAEDCEKRFRFVRGQRDLLLQLLLLVMSGNSKTISVMDYLASAEVSEVDAWMRDDIRIAWLTCLFAARGDKEPFVTATYRVLGVHPNKVWGAILERRRAILGEPAQKKQPESVRVLTAKAGAE